MNVIRSISLLFALTMVLSACSALTGSGVSDSEQLDLNALWSETAQAPKGQNVAIQCRLNLQDGNILGVAVLARADEPPQFMPASSKYESASDEFYSKAQIIFQSNTYRFEMMGTLSVYTSSKSGRTVDIGVADKSKFSDVAFQRDVGAIKFVSTSEVPALGLHIGDEGECKPE